MLKRFSVFLFLAENVTVVDVKFDLLWNSSMGTKGSLAFNGFRDLLQLNVSNFSSLENLLIINLRQKTLLEI